MSHTVVKSELPENFPTHEGSREFWEWLGRTVAAFAFLEDCLKRAMFAFSGKMPVNGKNHAETDRAFKTWTRSLAENITNSYTGALHAYVKVIKRYEKTVQRPIENFEIFEELLLDITPYRHALCHGAWVNGFDDEGGCIPRFIRKKNGAIEVFDTRVDVALLQKIHSHVAELSVEVINSVTAQGWQFPGGAGPGEVLWPRD